MLCLAEVLHRDPLAAEELGHRDRNCCRALGGHKQRENQTLGVEDRCTGCIGRKH